MLDDPKFNTLRRSLEEIAARVGPGIVGDMTSEEGRRIVGEVFDRLEVSGEQAPPMTPEEKAECDRYIRMLLSNRTGLSLLSLDGNA